MRIHIRRLLWVAMLLPLLIGPASALAQPPAPESPFGAADLFKKPGDPDRDAPFARSSRSPELAGKVHEYLSKGTIYFDQQRYAEAEAQYAAAIVLAEKPEGSPDDLVVGLFYQANVTARRSKLDESRRLIERAVGCELGRRNISGVILDFMFELSEQVYLASARVSELEPVWRGLYSSEVRSLGLDHPQVARHANVLGNYLIRWGKWAEAEEIFAGRLAIAEGRFGPESPERDEALDRLLLTYDRQAKSVESVRLLRRILEDRQHRLGPNHEKVAESFLLYAAVLRSSGRDAEADGCVARAMGIRWRNGLVAMVASLRACSSLIR